MKTKKASKMSVRVRLILGFGLVVLLSTFLAIYAVISVQNASDNYQHTITYSQARSSTMKDVRHEIMNLRRIANAARADSGMTDRLQSHSAESDQILNLIFSYLDEYIHLANEDTALSAEEKNYIIGVAEQVRDVTARYKRDMIDVNIAYGMVGDSAAATANTLAQSALVNELYIYVDELDGNERTIFANQLERTKEQTDTYILLLIIIAVVIIIVSAVVALVISKRLSDPLVKLTKSANEIAEGNIQLTGLDSGTTATKNEIILLERAFSNMLEQFKAQAFVLARVAEGDYTSKIDVRSENDTINMAIEIMVKETLEVLHKVALTGVQVSEGAQQIAAGAQVLAQGSTEQAATVEELSASMSEIASNTKENADLAGQAADLADTIKNSAEKGSVQMAEMIEAVKEINQASQSISKVIKDIDDIAFQTNILALNAAVEAARAGQHGKGFAVVAEEVRTLAAKSAESAKNTGVLISNSMEKAQLGSQIASETAGSLDEIVQGINESAKIVKDIAVSSESQHASINQINKGVEQVAQVVQQNSATAEESAAASEQMSAQSTILEDLIRQFNLREKTKLLTD